jgi:hypothetical protein
VLAGFGWLRTGLNGNKLAVFIKVRVYQVIYVIIFYKGN